MLFDLKARRVKVCSPGIEISVEKPKNIHHHGIQAIDLVDRLCTSTSTILSHSFDPSLKPNLASKSSTARFALVSKDPNNG